nr:hypothetical protein [Tanacetum cinerariifolium]
MTISFRSLKKSVVNITNSSTNKAFQNQEGNRDDLVEGADSGLQSHWDTDVQGKGKEKVVNEQAAHYLLNLQTPKKKSLADQFVFHRHTLMPTEPSGHAESPSLYEEVPGINDGYQDKGQAGPNLGDAVESQPQSIHVVHAGPNLEHIDLKATDASTQQNPEQIDEEFTITAYPNVYENLKLPTEDQLFAVVCESFKCLMMLSKHKSCASYTMADMNIPTTDAPDEQAPVVAPPTKTDDQILPSSKWVPIDKRNCDIMCFNSSNGLYSCQLDEQWFNLHKDILRYALDITPTNDNNPYVETPSSDTHIKYVNTLGYPSTLRNVLAMSVNALYQPWRAILSMINMFLTGKTAGYDRPRHHVLQILWGIIHRSNIDYAKRIWEEFVQSIQTFLTDRKNSATASRGKKKTTHLLILNVRFTKLIIHHLKTKHNIHPRTGSPLHYSHDENVLNTLRFVGKDGREIFGMSIPDALLTDEIKGAPYYAEYQEHVAKYQQYLDVEHGKAEEG